VIVKGHEHRQIIEKAADSSYPRECCGLLAGRVDNNGNFQITRISESENVATSNTYERFEVDPKVRFDLMKMLEDSDEGIIGHYHSHPDSKAVPSAYDLEMVFEPDLIWIIASVIQGKTDDIRAYAYDEGNKAFLEMELLTRDKTI